MVILLEEGVSRRPAPRRPPGAILDLGAEDKQGKARPRAAAHRAAA